MASSGLQKNNRLIAQMFFGLVLLIFSITLVAPPALAQTLSQDDQKSIYSDTVWYKPGAASTISCTTTNLTGSGAEQQVWNYYISKQLSPIATAALMGNFKDESNFIPTATNPSSGAYGLAQWLNGRLTSLNSFASSAGAPVSDLGVQLDFSWQELSGSYKAPVTDVINGAVETIDNATLTVYDYYEGLLNSGQGSVSDRTANAIAFLTLYGSDTTATGGGGFSSSCNSATIGASGGSNTTPPTGTAQQLATKLIPFISSNKIQCLGSGGAHTANINCSDITDSARGISLKGVGGCDVGSLSPGLLGMLLKLVQMGHTFDLSAICTDHGDTGTSAPGHSTGQAADFAIIDGTDMGPSPTPPWSPAKIQAGGKLDQDITSFMPTSTGFGQIQCHPPFAFLNGFVTFDDTCHHQHVQVVN